MSTEITKKPIRQVANVRELLVNESAKRQIAQVAAKHLNADRITGIIAKSLRLNPKLGEADPLSMLGAVMTCAAVGLEPDPSLGLAYLVPFKSKKGTEVQVILGFRGLMALARRSGEITSIAANIHYSDDLAWDYEEGTDSKLRHVPGDGEGEPLHAYAIAKFRGDGGHAFVVLSWKQVLKVRDGSQGWQTAVRFNATEKNPWHTHTAAMAKKTAIRALAKYLPMSVEMQDAISVDERRADFRGFALDPGAGVSGAIEIEGEAQEVTEDDGVVEQEAETTTAEQQVGNSAANALADARAKAAAAASKSKPRTNATPYAERGQAEKKVEAKEPDPKSAWSSDWEKEAADARNAMLDLAPDRAGEVLDMLTVEQIEAWKAEDPDGWAALMADITEREAS